MASRQSQKRLTKEYKTIQQNPPPYIIAKPNDENILEWHYVITGPANTPFEDGQFHGMLRFPTEYPFKPPSITIITPNGRFACNTRLCLSMSDYHPDTWNPAWSVATILTGLLSFMTGDESTTGSITTSESVKRKLAKESKTWNSKQNPRFIKIFPDLVAQNKIDIEIQTKLDALEKAKTLEEEKPLALTTEKISLLDPEDRARLMVEQDADIVNKSFSSLTFVGVVVAAFLAAYFTLVRRG
jgi:ubiquitin-conjugating enzyme E2 J2